MEPIHSSNTSWSLRWPLNKNLKTLIVSALLVASVYFFITLQQRKATNTNNVCHFPAIFNFGDSNSDTGGKSAAFYHLPSPNGNTFFHKPSGRYCNGRIILDFIGGSSFVKTNLPRPEDFSKALYTFDIGKNDLHSGLKSMTQEQLKESFPSIINLFVQAVEVS